MRLIDNLFSVSEQSTCGITPQAMTPQATLAAKCTEALKMKIKKYCQFERTSALETLLQTNNCLTLLDDYDSDGQLVQLEDIMF